MAKNKKAQILAAVMCATTIVGFSPVITHAADTTISSSNGSASVEAGNNGTVTVKGERFEVVTSDETSFIVNNAGTIAIKNSEVTGGNAFTVDKSGNIWTNGNIKGKNIKLSNDVGSIDTLTGNRLLSAKANGTEYFFVKEDGLIGSKDNAGKVVFQVQNGEITAESLKVKQDIQLKDGTSLQNMADTVKGLDGKGNIPNIAGIRRTDDNFKAPGEATTIIENTLTVDGTANKVSMNNGTFEIAKNEGNGQSTKTDVKAGYVGITNKNGDTTFAVDSSGVVRAANGAFGVNATGDVTANSINAANGRFTVSEDGSTLVQSGSSQLIVNDNIAGMTSGNASVAVSNNSAEIRSANNLITADLNGITLAERTGNTSLRLNEDGLTITNEEGFPATILGNDGSILAGKNGNFKVTSDGVLSVGNEKFTVDQYGGVKASNIISKDMYVGSQTAENRVVTAGQLNTSIDEATEGNVKWDKINGKYQEGTLNGVTLNDGNLKASNIVTNTFQVVDSNGDRTFQVFENGAFTAAAGKLAVDENGNLTSKGDVVSTDKDGKTHSLNDLALGLDSVIGINGTLSHIEHVNNGSEHYTKVEGTKFYEDGSLSTANGKFAVDGNGNATITGQNGTTVVSDNGLSITDSTGAPATSITSEGIATTGNGYIGGRLDVAGDFNAGGNGYVNGDLYVGGTINGVTITQDKDGNAIVGGTNLGDFATDKDVTDLKNKIGTDTLTTESQTITGAVNEVNGKVGDLKALDGDITARQEYKDNQSLVGAINAESAMRQELSGRVDNLDSRVGSLEDRMGDVEDRIDKVGAMAAAIANLRTMGYDPEAPTEIAVGVGQYESETGLALGVFHYPNQDFMLSASISTSGDEVMGGIGATWKIGRKSSAEKARSVEEKRVAKAEEMQEMAKAEKVKAQRERHAQMLAEREAAK
ncbi:YadA-like family protein [Megamonas hypermegale]|uniref:YadA-like family protein n=1 Tax=Megamonas hypermegale TaxID=158847 RepID=UPI0025A4680E|nr:YadA-like family protein [Megamonas hypermegale]MDM8142842.1 YadA-like family protein [Megamonas hypermegale]